MTLEQQLNTQLKTTKDKAKLEEALRHYCRYHLKAGDLEQVPQLRKYIDS